MRIRRRRMYLVMYDHTCKYCGKKFESPITTTELCSPLCRSRYKKGTPYQERYYCKCCGKDLGEKRKQYCSPKCYYKASPHYEKHTEPRVCKECGNTFTISSRHCYCSDKCRDRANGRVKTHRRRMRMKGDIDFITLRELADRDKNVCHICKRKVDWSDFGYTPYFTVGPDYPSIDHLKPLARGGEHKWNNVKLAHHRCNSIKNCNEIYEGENGQLTFAL